MTIQERLSEIEERANKATPGPWFANIRPFEEGDWTGVEFSSGGLFGLIDRGQDSDAKFVAASRTDIPKLVKALRCALEALDKYTINPEHMDKTRDEWFAVYSSKALTEIERILNAEGIK